jgi:hypothetical protein
MITHYSIELDKDEEKIGQVLTRDAWGYFSALISQREIFHVKEIPMMPRGGLFEIANDAELIQYYLDTAHCCAEELSLHGWDSERFEAAAAAFFDKLERATGLRRGLGIGDVARSA